MYYLVLDKRRREEGKADGELDLSRLRKNMATVHGSLGGDIVFGLDSRRASSVLLNSSATFTDISFCARLRSYLGLGCVNQMELL